MRSIAVKLTLAFLLVGLTGALLVVFTLWLSARSAFDQFIVRRDQQTLVDNLIAYYQAQGSWEGVANGLPLIVEAPPPSGPGDKDFHRRSSPFSLIAPDYTIIMSSFPEQVGQKATSRELDRAVQLVVDDQVVGWLSLPPVARTWIPDSPEGIFLRNINRATLVSALVAAGLALILGSLLAFTMTRSLRELTEATVEIASGRLGKQVKVRSKDELGELAASFNKMSLDLERATQARRQMTADVAHDLRTPLSVITGYAEALSDGKLSGTSEVYTILHRETQLLSLLIDDLRTLSLADAGELQLNFMATDPQALLERVVERYAFAAQGKGVTLRIEAGGASQPITVDPERMMQVFDNLVANAFRYTPSGGEVVLATKMENGHIQFQVRDNGSGIAPEDLPYVFDRFYRGDKSRQQNGESGLGLAIAKSIVELHAGKIELKSTPGEGTVFTITFASG